MRSFEWMTAVCLAAVVSVGVPAVAEHIVAAGEGKTVTQLATGQGLERERAIETDVAVMLADGRYVAVIDMVKGQATPSAVMMNAEGVAYEHLGGYEDARLSYEESIRLNPKYAVAYNNLGTIYHSRHNLAMAMKLYKKSIKLDSKGASAYKNLGAAYFANGKTRRGAEAFEQALTLDAHVLDRQGLSMDGEDRGSLITMNYFLAQLCARSGRTDAAIVYLNRAIAEGFRDYGKLQKDDAFAAVRGMPEFPTKTASR